MKADWIKLSIFIPFSVEFNSFAPLPFVNVVSYHHSVFIINLGNYHMLALLCFYRPTNFGFFLFREYFVFINSISISLTYEWFDISFPFMQKTISYLLVSKSRLLLLLVNAMLPLPLMLSSLSSSSSSSSSSSWMNHDDMPHYSLKC